MHNGKAETGTLGARSSLAMARVRVRVRVRVRACARSAIA